MYFRRAEEALVAVNDAIASTEGGASRLYSNKAYIELFLEQYDTALESFHKTTPEVAVLLGSVKTSMAQGAFAVAQGALDKAGSLPLLDETSRFEIAEHTSFLQLASGTVRRSAGRDRRGFDSARQSSLGA